MALHTAVLQYIYMPAGESGEESPSDAPVRKKRGSSGLPHGVIQVKRRFQARAPFKADPDGATKATLRSLGCFSTPEEAAAAVAAAEAKIAAGESPWEAPVRTNKYKRNEVRTRPLTSCVCIPNV